MGRAAACAMAITMVLCVAFMPLWGYGSDPLAVREEARSILLHFELHCDPNVSRPLSRPGQYFSQNPVNGLSYSKYGLFGSIASLPPLAAEYALNGQLPPLDTENRDRLYLLNLYNVLLSVAVAGLLVRLAANYTASPFTAGAFAVTSLFCTFAWNYLRAQSSEVVQLLLGVLLADLLIRLWRTGRSKYIPWAWVATAALVLTRVSYIQLLPLVATIILLRGRKDQRLSRATIYAAAGATAVILLIGWVQYTKFGSPFSSGYDQWQPARHRLSWNLGPGLYGFLVDPQWSIWVHFPLMVVALPGYWLVWRRQGAEAFWLAGALVMPIMLLAGLPSWAGEWCYGPRYLLYVLPVAALPAIAAWDDVLRWKQKRLRAVVMGLTACTLLVSFALQVQFNRLEFFTSYFLRGPLVRFAPDYAVAIANATNPASFPGSSYFDHRPHSLVIADLLAASGDADLLPFAAEARAAMSAEQWAEYRVLVKKLYQQGNLWWVTGGKRFVRDNQGNKMY